MPGHYLAPRRRRLDLHRPWVRCRDIERNAGRHRHSGQQWSAVIAAASGRRPPTAGNAALAPEQAVLALWGRRVQNSVKFMGDGARQNRGADR